MEYPYEVKIKSPTVAKKAKAVSAEMAIVRTEMEKHIDTLENLRKKLWVILDKDENIDAKKMSYTYNGEDHTITCEGEMNDVNPIVEGLMKMMAGGGTPPSTTRH